MRMFYLIYFIIIIAQIVDLGWFDSELVVCKNLRQHSKLIHQELIELNVKFYVVGRRRYAIWLRFVHKVYQVTPEEVVEWINELRRSGWSCWPSHSTPYFWETIMKLVSYLTVMVRCCYVL